MEVQESTMASVKITRKDFLEDRQGRTFVGVANDPDLPFDEVIEFFNDADRQRRMEESETHHDRAPMAGVVRELESRKTIHQFLATKHPRNSQRLRQAIGVLVRMIMEGRGWRKTGKKGSLGVRGAKAPGVANHNTGGLAFWFIRAERYQQAEGMPFASVRQRCRELEAKTAKTRVAKRTSKNGQVAKRTRSADRETGAT
jgi:hypothetical protein